MRFNCDYQNAESWQIRADNAVEMLLANNAVASKPEIPLKIADFGCGNEKLKPILQSRINHLIDYYGYDLQPQLESTSKINLEHEIPSLKFDVVFCLGLLEYLSNLDNLFANIAQICNFALISYVIRDSGAYSQTEIFQNAWLHHYSCAEIEIKFLNNQLIKQDFGLTNKGKTGLWLLKSEFYNQKSNIF
jgi:SAM-dependent methyltransferase